MEKRIKPRGTALQASVRILIGRGTPALLALRKRPFEYARLESPSNLDFVEGVMGCELRRRERSGGIALVNRCGRGVGTRPCFGTRERRSVLVSSPCGGHDGGRRHEAVSKIVNHDAKPFDGSHPEKAQVGRQRKDDFIRGFITFGPQNGVANVALDQLFGGGLKGAFAARLDADFRKHFGGEPGEFSAGIDQHVDRWSYAVLVLRIACDDVDTEGTHGKYVSRRGDAKQCMITPKPRYNYLSLRGLRIKSIFPFTF